MGRIVYVHHETTQHPRQSKAHESPGAFPGQKRQGCVNATMDQGRSVHHAGRLPPARLTTLAGAPATSESQIPTDANAQTNHAPAPDNTHGNA